MKKTLFLIFMSATMASAQVPGQIDASFGNNGLAIIPGTYIYPRGIDFEDYTGKTTVGGSGENNTALIARYNFNGTPDTSFNGNGIVNISDLGTSQLITDVDAAQPGSGSVLVTGYFIDSNDVSHGFIRKYLANGILDPAFADNGTIVMHNSGLQIKALPDATFMWLEQSASGYGLRKFTASGTATGGEGIYGDPFSYQFAWMSLQSDGKVLLSGTYYDGVNNYPLVSRINANGSSDLTFGNAGRYIGTITGYATHAVAQSSGKIVVGNAGLGAAYGFLRLLGNGTLDTSFGSNGYANYALPDNTFMDEIGIEEAGDNIVVAGGSGDNGFNVAMAPANGAPNFIFNTQNIIPDSPYDEAWCLDMMSKSFVIAAGTTTNNNFDFSLVVRRIFTKIPVISMIGNAYGQGDFTTDLDMTTTDGTIYTLNNITLTASGEVKFRMDHDWRINWGASLANDFPSGISTMGLDNIQIPTAGTYNITFNFATGQYTFSQVLAVGDNEATLFALYPNPVSQTLYITSASSKSINKIMVSDVSGKKILEQNGQATSIDVSQLASGLYVVQVYSEQGHFTAKFVKR